MSNLRPILLFCSMTSWDKQCTQSLFRNTHSVPATKISSYHIPCKLQKDSSAPAFHYTLYLVRSPVPSHGCRNLYRYDFSICFELFRITCQKNERRGKKYYMSDGERFLHYFFNKHSNRERSRTITIGHKMTTFYGIKTDPPSLNAEVCPRDTSIATWIL